MPIRASTSVSGGCSWVGPLGPAFGRPDGKLSETIVGLAVGKGLMGSLRPTPSDKTLLEHHASAPAERPIEGPGSPPWQRLGSDHQEEARRRHARPATGSTSSCLRP